MLSVYTLMIEMYAAHDAQTAVCCPENRHTTVIILIAKVVLSRSFCKDAATLVLHVFLVCCRTTSSKSLSANDGESEVPEAAEEFLMTSAQIRLKKAFNPGRVLSSRSGHLALRILCLMYSLPASSICGKV